MYNLLAFASNMNRGDRIAESYPCPGLLAARRMGELCPPEKPPGKKIVRTSDELQISKQRLSDFRKLAEIPLGEFREKDYILLPRCYVILKCLPRSM